jgi:hypothetical protein
MVRNGAEMAAFRLARATPQEGLDRD